MKIIISLLVITITISSIRSIEETEKENDLKIKHLINKVECERKTKTGDYLSVHYKGSFENGTQFDTSIGKSPYKFALGAGQVIKGYDIGLLDMCEGDKRELTVPHHLAYGESGSGNGIIPGKATLIFEVELVKIHDDFLEKTVIKSVEGCTRKSSKGDVLKVHYKLTSEDGQINYSTYDKKEPYEFTVGMGLVMRGYDTGLLDMCIGEIRKLKFESHAVYGNLISEVLLLEINGSKEEVKTDL